MKYAFFRIIGLLIILNQARFIATKIDSSEWVWAILAMIAFVVMWEFFEFPELVEVFKKWIKS